MPDNKHTPGPWNMLPVEDDEESVAIYQGKDNTCENMVGYVVAGDNRLANARLMATAPEMLDALKEVFDSHLLECTCGAPDENCRFCAAAPMVDRLRITIAKVEGA